MAASPQFARPIVKKKSRGKKKKTSPSLAMQADKHAIYQLAVQSPETDVELLQNLYKKCRGKKAWRLREDFCGTGLTLAHWVAQGKRYSGEGFDIDPDPVKWGRDNNLAPLGKAAERGVLHIADARAPSTSVPDIRCSFNFSHWVFTTRETLLEYFRSAYLDLAETGVFVLDATGGTEALSEEPFETEVNGLTLIWQQRNYSPVTATADLTLRFRMADGSEVKPPYRYRWRVWSLPEVLELLQEAGFQSTRVWWEDEDDPEIGYRVTQKGSNDTCWVACITALK